MLRHLIHVTTAGSRASRTSTSGRGSYHRWRWWYDGFRVSTATRYRLRRPVVGFIESENHIVTIPAGAIVSMASRPSVGLCLVAWQGRLIETFREDVERNGAVLKQPLIQ
jgi:hypothetical protein